MESLIGRRLASDEELCALLATFGAEPAIFYQKASADTDSPEKKYPHVIFTVDRYSDTQKGVAGILNVDIFSAQHYTPPEDIERLIRPRLEGVFFRPQDGEIFSLKWQRSDVFTEPASERAALIIGVTMTFEIYEWPLAETSSPDPIQALNEWASRFEVAVIGVTEFEEIFEPSRDRPAVYFDVQKSRLAEQKNAAVFVDVTINLHVFAPDVRSRRAWLALLNQELLLTGTFPLADSSPLRLLDAEYIWAASETTGQIQYKFSYVMVRQVPYTHPLIQREISTDENLRWRLANS